MTYLLMMWLALPAAAEINWNKDPYGDLKAELEQTAPPPPVCATVVSPPPGPQDAADPRLKGMAMENPEILVDLAEKINYQKTFEVQHGRVYAALRICQVKCVFVSFLMPGLGYNAASGEILLGREVVARLSELPWKRYANPGFKLVYSQTTEKDRFSTRAILSNFRVALVRTK